MAETNGVVGGDGAKPPAGRVAVVTGTRRGAAGRGIAIELGAAGATVYVTGRSTRGEPAGGYERMLGALGLDVMPDKIDETAEEVTRAGARASPCAATTRASLD
jgi:NAD(P)-dependent dehydrogenase (short-subunit alcohol dehydrogenase family)